MTRRDDEIAAELAPFDDNPELVSALHKLADAAVEERRWSDAYYLRECAVHLEGLYEASYDLAFEVASARAQGFEL